MSNLTFAEGARLIDASFGTATYTAPTGAMKLALNTAVGNGTTAGTEVTGGSYARQTLTMGAAVTTTGANASSNAQTYTNMPAVTTTSIDVFDSNGTPRRAWWGTLTGSKTTALGDTLSFAIGAITGVLS